MTGTGCSLRVRHRSGCPWRDPGDRLIGIRRIPVAGHPEGHPGLARMCAWMRAIADGRFALDDEGGFKV